MKTSASLNFLNCAALVLTLGWCATARAEKKTNATSRIAAPALIKSVFVADSSLGKDPFFPLSTRRQQIVEQATPVTTNAAPPSELFNQLALKGISGARGQMLALINSSTVSVGELAEIRLGVRTVKIRCREIRAGSVIIELEGLGEIKELKLREGI